MGLSLKLNVGIGSLCGGEVSLVSDNPRGRFNIGIGRGPTRPSSLGLSFKVHFDKWLSTKAKRDEKELESVILNNNHLCPQSQTINLVMLDSKTVNHIHYATDLDDLSK